jgi:hypothetical protein
VNIVTTIVALFIPEALQEPSKEKEGEERPGPVLQ